MLLGQILVNWLIANIIGTYMWRHLWTVHKNIKGACQIRNNKIWARFLSLTLTKLRLCSTNHRVAYFRNLACDWLSIVWAYSEQETENGPWWLCLVPTSTTKFDSDVGYRMAKPLIRLYKELIFMNGDFKFLSIEWRTPYPLTHFEGRFGLRASVIYWASNIYCFLFFCTLASSQTLVVNWQNFLFILFH